MNKFKPEYLIYGVGAFIAWSLYKKTGEAVTAVAGEIADGVNPTSTDNWLYSGINAVGDVIDDGGDNNSFSLGSWLYEVTHPNEGF